MGERNNKGYLRAEQLKTGKLDQHATVRGGRYFEVTLGWQEGDGFYVHHVIRRGSRLGTTLLDERRTYPDIDKARSQFRALTQPNQRFTR